MVRCENCGHDNKSNAAFCEECGLTLNDTSSFGRIRSPKPKEGMSTTNKILIASIVILAIVLGIMVVYLLISPTNQATTPNNTTANNTTAVTQQISLSSGFPVSEVPKLAQEISKKGVSFSTISFSGVTLDKNQCLYILSRGIVMINKGETGNIPVSQYGNATNPYGTVTSATITKKQYVDMAQRTYTWMDNNGIAPNYLGIKVSGQADLSPDSLLNLYTKVLTQYKSTGQLPANTTIP
jgi:hypothetical protein